jgi:hypothetical protein
MGGRDRDGGLVSKSVEIGDTAYVRLTESNGLFYLLLFVIFEHYYRRLRRRHTTFVSFRNGAKVAQRRSPSTEEISW